LAYSTIKFEAREGVAFLTLSRPQVANALNDTMAIELTDACQIIRQRDDIRVVILSGEGEKGFCAGGDLKEFADGLENHQYESKQRLVLRSNSVNTIASLNRPVIAAVHGYALGLGLGLALGCDIRIADDSAVFASPDVGKGYIPMSGVTQRLPRLIGRGKALEMLVTGERIDAQEAWRIGLVNKVVPRDRLLPEAEEWARKLAAKAPVAMRFARETVNKGMDMTLEQGLRLEADLYFLLFSTRDRTEGVTAFREKRAPNFTGQ